MGRAVVLFAFALSACTHTRDVTPWLRTSIHRPFEIMAESGGPKPTAATERKIGERWVRVSQQSLAMPLAGGRLAVFYAADGGLVLGDARRDLARIPCDVLHLRATPSESNLTCLEFMSWIDEPNQDTAFVLEQFDLTGASKGRRTVVLPGGSLPRPFFPHFIGFLRGSEPVMSVHVSADVETGSFGVAKLCACYVVRGDRFERLAALTTTEWPRCGSAEFWKTHYALDIAPGATLEAPDD